MKRTCLLSFTILLISNAGYIESAQRSTKTKKITRNAAMQNPQPNEDDEELKIVLTNFACIVNHFVNIVQNPKNTQNVAQGIGGILCNIGTVIAQAIKSHAITDAELEILECEQEILTKKLAILRRILHDY